MKTIIKLSVMLTIGALWVGTFGSAQAQMSQYKFKQMFNQAFADVLVNDYEEAIPRLEHLRQSQPDHAQVTFLLALSYLETGKEGSRTVKLLESASTNFDIYHQFGRVEGRSAPGKVWLLLGDAYEQNGQFRKAVSAYRTYMTTIPMASIYTKREVINRIEDARYELALQNQGDTNVELFAKLKP